MIRSHHLAIGFAVAVTVAACSDADTPSAPQSGKPYVTVAAEGGLRDDGIDLRDTYFAFTVSTSRTMDAPAGAIGAASIDEGHATDESTYLEAGFGGDGALRFNIYSDGAADPRVPAPPAVMRTIGNSVYLYDAWGSLLGAYLFNDFMEGAGLPGGDLASGTPYGSLYNPIGGGGVPGDQPIQITGLEPGRMKVNRVGEDVLQVTTSSGSGAQAGVQAAALRGPAIQTTRTFRRRMVPTTAEPDAVGQAAGAMAHWVLESVEQVANGAGGGATARTRTTFSYVAAHINRGKDRQREKASADRPPPASSHVSRSARAADPAPMQSGGGETASSLDGINLCEKGQGNFVRSVAPGGGSVVYQHGFCSDATTWSAMRQRVPETHRVGVEQTYSLNSDAPVEAQVTDLASRLTGTGTSGNVVVAHSQGGLVARRLGQRRPDLVSGVVTIGTPHEGALIASYPPQVIANALNDAIDEPCFGTLCWVASEVAEAVTAGLITHGVGELVPAAGDDRPGSALIQRVNGKSEYQYETFRRASIAMSIDPRWALFRMIGDAGSSRDRLLRNEPLRGQEFVHRTQRAYDAARMLRFMAMALRWWATDYGYGWGCHQSGYANYWEPCYNRGGYQSSWWEAGYWYHVADALDYIGSTVVWVLDVLDRTWDSFTTHRKDGTDGFVQLASQHYPAYVPGAFPVRRFLINGAEAHTGETASQHVLDQLRPALDVAGLPRY